MLKIIASILFLLPFLAHAEEKPDLAELKHPVKACLFKVEGNELEKTSYLFGTIHLSDPRVLKLHPNAEAAFKASDTFYAEIDLDPGAQLQVAPLRDAPGCQKAHRSHRARAYQQTQQGPQRHQPSSQRGTF